MKKLLLLDNYDSFTYNLLQYVEELTKDEIVVAKNDRISLEEVDNFDTIILSPGPGLPNEAGIMMDLLRAYADTKKIFGVCLGHQAIVENFGGNIRNLKNVYHGVATRIHKTAKRSILFNNIPDSYLAGRYHSWAAAIEKMPKELVVTGVDDYGEIMAIEHNQYPVYGVQYHPESIMTAVGKKILANFLDVPYTVSERDFALNNATA